MMNMQAILDDGRYEFLKVGHGYVVWYDGVCVGEVKKNKKIGRWAWSPKKSGVLKNGLEWTPAMYKSRKHASQTLVASELNK